MFCCKETVGILIIARAEGQDSSCVGLILERN